MNNTDIIGYFHRKSEARFLSCIVYKNTCTWFKCETFKFGPFRSKKKCSKKLEYVHKFGDENPLLARHETQSF